MYSQNRWLYYTEAIDKITCEKIISLADDKWMTSETIAGAENVRENEVVWIKDQWVYDTIWPYMAEANEEAGWKYNIHCSENIQISRYKEGDFYSWHKDGKGDHLSIYTENNPILQNRVRKLSMSVILNNDYDGGDFQFTNYNKEKCEFETLSGATGSVLVFPSDLEHRVKPVTRGIRYSLVAWFLGPPFA